MIITWIYRLIVLYILTLVIWNLIEEEKIRNQVNNSLVIIPLVLRVLMIK